MTAATWSATRHTPKHGTLGFCSCDGDTCLFTWGKQLLYGSGTPLWNPTYPFRIQRLDSIKLDVLHIPSLHHWGKALLDLKFSLSLQCALGVIKATWHSELHQQGQQAKGSCRSSVWDINCRELSRDTERWLRGWVELSMPKDMFHHNKRDFTYDKYRNVRYLISKRGFSISLGAGLLSERMHILTQSQAELWLYQLTCSAAFCCAAMCCCSAWSRKSLFRGDLVSAMLQERTRWYDTDHSQNMYSCPSSHGYQDFLSSHFTHGLTIVSYCLELLFVNIKEKGVDGVTTAVSFKPPWTIPAKPNLKPIVDFAHGLNPAEVNGTTGVRCYTMQGISKAALCFHHYSVTE